MSLYNANGQINLTVVAGTSYTGLYAADGSYNVVLTTENTTIKGLHHPCGAYWGTVVTNAYAGYYAIDGSMNIISNGSGGYIQVVPAGSGVLNPAYVTDVLSISSLVGYWRGTDAVNSATIKDFSSSNLPATIAGGVTLGSTALISGQTSALFNGTTGTASLGATGETFFHNYERTQPWTVEFLVKPNAARVTQFTTETVWAKYDGSAASTGIRVGLQFLGGKELINVFMGNQNAGLFLSVYGSTDLTNGSIWHCVVSYNGSSNGSGISMWVNGIPEVPNIATNTLGTQTVVNSIAPTIGSCNGTTQFFHGNIEELATYNTAVGVTTSTLIASNVLDAGKPAYHYGLSLGRSPIAAISVPNLIVDTDISSDIGDVGAVTLACVLHMRGEANLVGVLANSSDVRSADAAYSIVKYLLGSAPSFVGAYQGSITNAGPASVFTGDISTTFGQNVNRTSYTDATQKYRALLMSQPDNSVVIASIGFFSNLDALLTSAANAGGDGFGTGAAIIAQKVKRVVVQGSDFLTGTADFNMAGVPAATADFFANCPVEIVATGSELGATTAGGPASLASSATSPIQQAWHDWNVASGQTTRPLWDEIAILTAVRGVSSNSGIVPAGLRGTNTINATNGNNAWTNTAGNTTYTRKSAADAAFASLITAMYAALPGHF